MDTRAFVCLLQGFSTLDAANAISQVIRQNEHLLFHVQRRPWGRRNILLTSPFCNTSRMQCLNNTIRCHTSIAWKACYIVIIIRKRNGSDLYRSAISVSWACLQCKISTNALLIECLFWSLNFWNRSGMCMYPLTNSLGGSSHSNGWAHFCEVPQQ